MSYRLLDPLHRRRVFRILESRKREFRLLEGFVDTAKDLAKSDWGADAYGKDLIKGGDAKSGLGKALGWSKDTRLIDRVQDTVDLIGIVDPTGVADAANALTYAARGKWGQAAVSALGIVPYLGDLAKGGKFLKAGAKGEKAVAKVAARSAERTAAKGALKGAEKAAEKAAVHAAEKGAAHAAEKGLLSRAKGAVQKGKEAWKKAQPYIERGREAQEKIQSRRDAEAQRAGKDSQANVFTRARGAMDTATGAVGKAQGAVAHGRQAVGQGKQAVSQAKAGGFQGAFDTAKSAFNTAKGAVSQGRQAVQSVRPERPQSEAPAAPSGPKKTQGGGGRTSIAKRPLVPVDADCPPGETKTSTWGAPDGMKRCHKQTPGRDH